MTRPSEQPEDQPDEQPPTQHDEQHADQMPGQPDDASAQTQQPEQANTQQAIKLAQDQVQQAAQSFADFGPTGEYDAALDAEEDARALVDSKVYKRMKQLWKETNRHMKVLFVGKNAPLTYSHYDKRTKKLQTLPNAYKVKDVIEGYTAQLQSIVEISGGTTWTVESFTKEYRLEMDAPSAADFARVDHALREAAQGVRAGQKRKAPSRSQGKGKGKKVEESTDDEMDVDEESEESEKEETSGDEEAGRKAKRPRKRAPSRAVLDNDDDERMSPESEEST
ncbi:hypothetical protein EV714DRAFT_273636 [Schizophyllum commune]